MTGPGVSTAATVPGRTLAEPPFPTASLDAGSPAVAVTHGSPVTGMHCRAPSADGVHDPAVTVDPNSPLAGSVPVPVWAPAAGVPGTAGTAPVTPLAVLPAAVPEAPWPARGGHECRLLSGPDAGTWPEPVPASCAAVAPVPAVDVPGTGVATWHAGVAPATGVAGAVDEAAAPATTAGTAGAVDVPTATAGWGVVEPDAVADSCSALLQGGRTGPVGGVGGTGAATGPSTVTGTATTGAAGAGAGVGTGAGFAAGAGAGFAAGAGAGFGCGAECSWPTVPLGAVAGPGSAAVGRSAAGELLPCPVDFVLPPVAS
jgi:hypothetical protein